MTTLDTQPQRAEEFLGLPVVSRGLRLGRVEDVVVGADGVQPVGFDVYCGDGVPRFLPVAAANVISGVIRVGSALALLEHRDAAFYFERGTRLSALPPSEELPGRDLRSTR